MKSPGRYSTSDLRRNSSFLNLMKSVLGLLCLTGLGVALFPGLARAETFTDAVGRIVTLKSPPSRIVSLAPNLTEILYFLGLGNRVVGVTTFSNYPKEASLKPKVGSYAHLNAERIISLSPDLVVATVDGNSRSLAFLLAQSGIQVFVVNPRNLEQTIETIRTLGRVCGVPERTAKLAGGLQRRVEEVERKTRLKTRPRVFLEIQIQPIMTVNRHTFHHDLIRVAGGENIFDSEYLTYPRVSLEEVIRRRPQVILISSMERGGRFEKARREWMKWKSIPAVQDHRVHLVDSDLVDRPSPRLVDGLESMARLIHPEIQWQ